MTNIQRQKWCDKEKWLTSEGMGFDCSGHMCWCDCCEHKQDCCNLSQIDREMNCICAKSYNRMVRARAKK